MTVKPIIPSMSDWMSQVSGDYSVVTTNEVQIFSDPKLLPRQSW